MKTYTIESVDDIALEIAKVDEIACDTFVTLRNGNVIQLGAPLCCSCDTQLDAEDAHCESCGE